MKTLIGYAKYAFLCVILWAIDLRDAIRAAVGQ